MRYVLENTLLFDHQQGTLTGITSGKSAKLPYAAVLLLQVFCEHPHVLLSRNDLMDRAWTGNGLRASGSNLYNSLSLIRRTVETLDVDLQIIRTQPKIGLIMEVTVERLEDAGHPSSEVISPIVAEPLSESVLSSADELQESGSLPDAAVESQLPVQQPAGRYSFSHLLPRSAVNFYLLWTLFIVVLLMAFHLFNEHRLAGSQISSESYYKMGTLQQCKLFRLDESSDVYADQPVARKIALLAAKYNIDCKNNRADFYINSRSNTHNTYNSAAQLNIVCVSDKTSNRAIDCFNDFVQMRRQ